MEKIDKWETELKAQKIWLEVESLIRQSEYERAIAKAIRLVNKYSPLRRSTFFSMEKRYLSKDGINPSTMKRRNIIEKSVAKNNIAFPAPWIRLIKEIISKETKKATV